jgi:fructose/tagatose bisphosphate aldolase
MKASLKEVLAWAEERNCAVGSFNTPTFENVKAVISAAEELGVPVLARLPMDAQIAALCDAGEIERVVCDELAPAADAVEALLK